MPRKPVLLVVPVAIALVLVGGLVAARELNVGPSAPSGLLVAPSSAGTVPAAAPASTPGSGTGVTRSASGGSGTLASSRCAPTTIPADPTAWRNASLSVRVPILMYHRVVPASEAGDSLPSLVTPPDLFDAQMAALHAAGWHTVTLRQLAADVAAGRGEPPRTFVVTFDDGYRDGFRYAMPVLQRYGFVGTYFVISGRVGMAAYLTAHELCAMTRAGDEIANHSVHHVGLGLLPAAQAANEISAATQAIQAWTGVRPDTLAYPFGNWSPALLPLLQRDGYAAAVTTVEGASESYGDRFLMPRVRVGPATTPADLLALVSKFGTP